MEGLAQMVEAQKLIQREVNPELSLGGIVLNMMDPDEELCIEVEAEVRKYFAGLVFEHSVRRDIRFAEAPSHGRALLNYAAKSRGCLGMAEVTKEFMNAS
jgi:chromosome partitioning protein